MEKKQTAVEWLWHHFNVSITKPDDSMLDKAKEMEKEQIIDAHYEGHCDNTEGYVKYIAQQYYKETYNK